MLKQLYNEKINILNNINIIEDRIRNTEPDIIISDNDDSSFLITTARNISEEEYKLESLFKEYNSVPVELLFSIMKISSNKYIFRF